MSLEADAAKLSTREVLLDLLLERRRDLDARLLEELDLHDFRIGLARADVEAGLVAFGLQKVARHCRRQHAEVGDVESGRGQAGDHRSLDHPARGRGLAARGNARPAFQRRAERGRDSDCASGVRSTLTRPATPSVPKSRVEARDSQIRLSVMCEPDSTSLYG